MQIDERSSEEMIEVSINISNTGNRAGKEVVQLYIQDLVASVNIYPVNRTKLPASSII